MTDSMPTAPGGVATRTTRDLTKAAVSGWLGTAMEFMDFQLYSLAAAIVFNRIFFPDVSPAIGLIAAMATYGVGYVARLAGADAPGLDLLGRDRASGPRPVVVERLAVRDRQKPAAEVVRVAQARVGAERRDHRLLEAVVGVDGPDGADEKPQDGIRVIVEQALKRRGHVTSTCRPRGT